MSHFLRSGEIAFFQQQQVIQTIVGVCAAVCIWDSRKNNGGMCHFKLPTPPAFESLSVCEYDIAEPAIYGLLKKFKYSQSNLENLQAKILGGSDIHQGGYIERQQIGRRNTEQAVKVLRELGININGQSIGGTMGRILQFNTFTGELLYKQISLAEHSHFDASQIDHSFLTETENYAEPVRDLICIGSSTGGIDALDVVLKQLPIKCPPVCIVQHIPNEYSKNLCVHLNEICSIPVQLLEEGVILENNNVYLAPGGQHCALLELSNRSIVCQLTHALTNDTFCPSIDHLFESVFKLKSLHRVAILLTGMGSDGAHAMKKLKQAGVTTLVQDQQSSVVYGLARAAVELKAVCQELPLNRITAAALHALDRSPLD